jgi:hypothetical protein
LRTNLGANVAHPTKRKRSFRLGFQIINFLLKLAKP